MASELSEKQTAKLKIDFEKMDVNKDGLVSKSEFKAHVKKNYRNSYTNDVIDEMMRQIDENGDGKIQFKEFEKAKTEIIKNAMDERKIYSMA